jgi:hypothetical protein
MARGHIEPRALVSHAECFWAKSAESLENNGVEFFAMQKSAQESEKKGDSSKNRLSVGKFEGRECVPDWELSVHPPGAFTRANAGLKRYGTWKEVPKIGDEGSGTERERLIGLPMVSPINHNPC